MSLSDEDEVMTVHNTDGQAGSGPQRYNVINESGLYSLVLTSRKAEAKRFKKWVTSEVLPQIRKTGQYAIHNVDTQKQMRYSVGKCFKTLVRSGFRPRSMVDFLRLLVLQGAGGFSREAKAHGYVHVLNTCPPSSKWVFVKTHVGVNP